MSLAGRALTLEFCMWLQSNFDEAIRINQAWLEQRLEQLRAEKYGPAPTQAGAVNSTHASTDGARTVVDKSGEVVRVAPGQVIPGDVWEI